MAQHRRSNLHLKDKGHSFEDDNVHILDGEDRWYERVIYDAVYVLMENPSLSRRGGLRLNLSPIFPSIPRKFKTTSHIHLTISILGVQGVGDVILMTPPCSHLPP
ncbi:hypothetical protein EXN66_Car006161 [Channa argus]|uniref:Uncharacterized protein n=1 Tax=Channa argus TaxID=215402 RepID=A0A6G1PKH4_CHAAH|nr:hypothetical protein EXN66_Car006161 [Channa argus]